MTDMRIPLLDENASWLERQKTSMKSMFAEEMKPDPLMDNKYTRPEEIGRMIFGTGVAAVFLMAIMSNKLEVLGAPPFDQKNRSTFYAQGKKAYSFRLKLLGEWTRWVEYRKMSPFSTILFTMSQINNLMILAQENPERLNADEMADMVIELANQTIRFVFTEQHAMQGVTGLIEALEGGAYNEGTINSAARFLRNQAGGFVPNILFSLTRSTDPTIYLTENLEEEFKKRIPGQQKDLIPRRDAFGRIVDRGESGISLFLNPYRSSIDTQDSLFEEMDRLRTGVAYPSKTVAGHRMTTKEYDLFLQDHGPRIELELRKLIKSNAYQNASDLERIEYISKTVNALRDESRKSLFGHYYAAQKLIDGYIKMNIDPNVAWERAKKELNINDSNSEHKVEQLVKQRK